MTLTCDLEQLHFDANTKKLASSFNLENYFSKQRLNPFRLLPNNLGKIISKGKKVIDLGGEKKQQWGVRI